MKEATFDFGLAGLEFMYEMTRREAREQAYKQGTKAMGVWNWACHPSSIMFLYVGCI
jgi:hypothetical protein